MFISTSLKKAYPDKANKAGPHSTKIIVFNKLVKVCPWLRKNETRISNNAVIADIPITNSIKICQTEMFSPTWLL